VAGPSPDSTWDALFSDFYLRAYADEERREEAKAQALGAARLTGLEPGQELLDVPCGFGRHAIPLAGAGYRVTAVDRSAVLLDEARRRAGNERWPKFVQADYRDLPFRDESFDAAVNLFTSLGYLGDEGDARVLAEIRRVLRPGGRLVIETAHRDALVLGWSESDYRWMGEGRVLLEQRTFDAASGIATTTQTLIDGAGERDARTWSVRVYTGTELLAMAAGAGFGDVKAYGDFDGNPFTPRTRLVVVARR
jgi:SAM-dependent methyltransferase